MRNWGGLDFDNVKTGADLEKEWSVSIHFLKLQKDVFHIQFLITFYVLPCNGMSLSHLSFRVEDLVRKALLT